MSDIPVWSSSISAGVKRWKCTSSDEYTGSREALLAAGHVRAEWVVQRQREQKLRKAKEAMLPTHDVSCPHCGKTLFSSTSLEDGVNAGTPESPAVQEDPGGLYMSCPHCAERVPMQRITRGSAVAYQVAGT